MESNPRYCAVCRNYGGMTLDGQKLSMHRFPSSSKLSKVKKIWIQRCALARANFKYGSYDSTRICGQHFVGGKGPTSQHNLPSIFHAKVYKTSFYDPSKSANQEGTFSIEIEPTIEEEVQDICHHEVSTSPKEEDFSVSFHEDQSNLDVSLTFHDYACVSVPEVQNVRHQSSQTSYLKVNATTQTDNDEYCKYSTNGTQTVITNSYDVGIQADRPTMTYEDVKDNKQKLMFYTGFPDSETFDAVFDEIKSDALEQTTGSKKTETGRPRSLRLIDEFFMVLMRLRLGLLLEDLADRFRIGTSTCGIIFNRWIDYLDEQLSFLVEWPSRENIDATITTAHMPVKTP